MLLSIVSLIDFVPEGNRLVYLPYIVRVKLNGVVLRFVTESVLKSIYGFLCDLLSIVGITSSILR